MFQKDGESHKQKRLLLAALGDQISIMEGITKKVETEQMES